MTIGRLATFLIKTVLRNTSFWVWSIVFMLFWATMGAYVFSRGITKERLINAGVPAHLLEEVWTEVVKYYTAGWFSSIVSVSFANTASILIGYVYYSTVPIRFLSKFSKASSKHLLASFVIGALAVFLLSMSILYAICSAMFSHRFGLLIPPANPVGLVVSSIIYGVTMYFMSMTLGLTAIILRKPGLVEKISYAPLTLGIALVMLSIYVGGGHFYLAPFNSAMALIYYYYTNVEPPYDEPLALARSGYTPLSHLHAWAVLIAWLLALALASLVLLKKQKGVPLEELVP